MPGKGQPPYRARQNGRMSLASRFAGRVLSLPPAVTHRVALDRDLSVRAPDGTILRTDHYAPDLDTASTILIRTPYGRRGAIGLFTARILAERGFHVILQSCRGTFGSGGTFEPLVHERDDGLAAIAWIELQPWFDGNLFTYGPSYVGFTQWAVADAGPVLKGAMTAVTASSFRDPTYAGGSFSLDTILNWATLVGNQGGSLVSFLRKQRRSAPLLTKAWRHNPIAEMDTIATGREIGFFQEWLTKSDDDDYWQERSHDHRVAAVTEPICMVGGWYDIFLPWQLADYAALRAAGRTPRLVIGPWSHTSRELFARSMREGIAWFRQQLDEPRPGNVELYIGGAEEWRTYADWPPESRTQEWFFAPDGALATAPAEDAEPDRFRYDPADPTPSPGGPLLTPEGGRVSNLAVEARSDVIVYSSAPLTDDVEAIGPVSAEIRVRSSSSYFDIFVRVCDVTPDGRSENISEGLTRIAGSDGDEGIHTVSVELWPIAYRWKAGHRIRVQIAGAAHPKYARNPGSGEPLGKATTLRAVEHEVFLDRVRPSVVRLPRSI